MPFQTKAKLTPVVTPQVVTEPSILSDTSKFLLNDDFYDIVFEVGDAQLHAHKIILCMRSDVFAAMFKSNMVEATTNVIEITDFDVDVVKEFLRYIYTDTCKLSQTCNLEELLAIADKYHVAGMKTLCEKQLQLILTVNNALSLLLLADKFSATSLKQQDFIYKPDFYETIGYPLCQEIMKAMYEISQVKRPKINEQKTNYSLSNYPNYQHYQYHQDYHEG